MRRSHPLVLAAAVLAGSACTSDVVAVYAGGRVTRGELLAWMEARGRELARHDPTERLRALVATRVLAAEARASRLASDAALAIRLQREELAQWRSALQRHGREAIDIPAAEVDAYLEAHRADLHRPRRVRLWNLFKRVQEGASAETREAVRREAEVLHQRLLAGEDFLALAAAESDSETRFQGGRMGAVPAGALRPEIETVAFALEPGEISQVVETPDGFTILRCQGIVEASTTSEEEARRRIREAMHRWRFNAEWPALLEELATSAAVAVDRATLTRPAGRPEDVVARSPLGELRRAELAALAVGRVGRTASLEDAERTARAHFTGLAVRRHAAALGLELDAEDRASLQQRQDRLLAEAALERRVDAQYRRPTDDEVQRFFESRPDRFQRPASYRLGLLRFDIAGPTSRATIGAAAEASRAARADAGFDAVAVALDPEPGLTVRLDTGWLPRRRVAGLGPSVLKAVESLAPGTTSEPVRQDQALWVVHLRGVEPAAPMTFEEAALPARSALEAARRSRLRDEALAALLAELDLRVVAPLPELPLPGARGPATQIASGAEPGRQRRAYEVPASPPAVAPAGKAAMRSGSDR